MLVMLPATGTPYRLVCSQGRKDFLAGSTSNNSVDPNRNFPYLDRIVFSNEQALVSHNNHILEQADCLEEPASARCNLTRHEQLLLLDRNPVYYRIFTHGRIILIF
jgi:hypothetical protein